MAKAKRKTTARRPATRRQPTTPPIDDGADLFDCVSRKEFEKACRDGEVAVQQLTEIVELLNARADNQERHIEHHCQGIDLALKGLKLLKQSQAEVLPPKPLASTMEAAPTPAKPRTVAVLRLQTSDLLAISLLQAGQRHTLRRVNEHNPFDAVARMNGDGTFELLIQCKE